ncbi:hypothetical protein GQC22_004360, partial [Salmonella enterica]|nr:hypothetical protein [Salmonella enterica]
MPDNIFNYYLLLCNVIIMPLFTITVIRKFSVIYLHVRPEVGYQYGK